MKALFDTYSYLAAEKVTKTYSTSFYAGVNLLDEKIRPDIHAIYGLVRFADEIVDSFHDFDKCVLLSDFKKQCYEAIEQKISLNPILNAFQATVNKYQIDQHLIEQFFTSMEMDTKSIDYCKDQYDYYIVGSAEVVGLMCLTIFVDGDKTKYESLKPFACKLASAFQKINFLRDLQYDNENLGRIYFPNLDKEGVNDQSKSLIENEIEAEFQEALIGIKKLPDNARLGVYLCYNYYLALLHKIKNSSTAQLNENRLRVNDAHKLFLFVISSIKNKLNLL